MLKAIYSECIPDPWIDVAKKLKSENNIIPAYWIIWDYEFGINQKDILLKEFPDTVFHSALLAWKGIFPEEVKDITIPILEKEVLEKYAAEELLAIKMMDRLDFDQYSFNFTERQRLFRHLLKMWLAIIKNYNIDILVSASIPHRVFDYVLYLACKISGVKIITYKKLSWGNYLIPINDVNEMPQDIDIKYRELCSKNESVSLPEKILKYINNVKADYSKAEPNYMIEQRKTAGNISVFQKVGILSKKPTDFFKILLNRNKDSKKYYKEKNKSLEKSCLTNKKYSKIKKNAIKYKKNLFIYYESICAEVDLEKNYILVALHYQPEETTCPSAGIYVDQFLMVEQISKSIPKDWFVFVKEHTSQFHPKFEGHISRMKDFYDDSLQIKNVKFVSTKHDPFSLIDNAKAVATATGTIGFEALLRNTPALVFGNAWYKQCRGAFYIKSHKDIKIAIDKIISNYHINSQEVEMFIKVLLDSSIKAYHYKELKNKDKISKSESINNLTKSVKAILN